MQAKGWKNGAGSSTINTAFLKAREGAVRAQRRAAGNLPTTSTPTIARRPPSFTLLQATVCALVMIILLGVVVSKIFF